MASRRFPVSLVSLLKQVIWLGGRHWWLSFLLWLVLVGPAQAAMELRVAIKEGVSRVQLGSSTKAIVRDATGQEIAQLEALNGFSAHGGGSSVELGKLRSSQLSIEPTDGGFVWIGDRWYRGRTLLVPTSGGLTAVNIVNLEQYLYSVLGAEMSADWPQEALKAQAVAARSYALYKRATAGNKVYDLGDTTKWQVYKGLETEGQGTHLAVDATAGQVMTYGGQIILAVFHASSGGHTENVENVWTGSYPYLRGVADYDMGSPGFEWTKNFSRSELSRRISGVGSVISMTPEHTTPSGRIVTMIVKGDRATRRISGNDLRSALGLRSTLFVVNPTDNGFQLHGRGYGHG
ncbi:MAG TPA: sporulation protein, partial [Cyanobacteria bacterium UBA8543]|nr:sporulation protein [Cyanobacteria bacterium UBA8543]